VSLLNRLYATAMAASAIILPGVTVSHNHAHFFNLLFGGAMLLNFLSCLWCVLPYPSPIPIPIPPCIVPVGGGDARGARWCAPGVRGGALLLRSCCCCRLWAACGRLAVGPTPLRMQHGAQKSCSRPSVRSAQLPAAWRMVRYVPAAAGACAAGLRCRCCTCSYIQPAGRRGRRCSGALLQQAPSSAADLVPRRARNYVAIREGLTTTWCACALRPVPNVVCDTAGVPGAPVFLDVPFHHCCTCPPPPCALHSSTGIVPPRDCAGMVPKA